MSLIDWLRRLGILRWGAKGGTYTSAADRPAELMTDGVFDAGKDLVPTGPIPGACPRCGTAIKPGDGFCVACGQPVSPAAGPPAAAPRPALSPRTKALAIGCVALALVAAGLLGVLILAAHLMGEKGPGAAAPTARKDEAAAPATTTGKAAKSPARSSSRSKPAASPAPKAQPPASARPGAASPSAPTGTMPVPSGARFGRMDNPRLGYRCELPAHWVSEVRDGSQVFSGPKGAADRDVTLNFQVIHKTPGSSLKGQAEEVKGQLARMKEYALHGERETELRGHPTVFLMAVFRPQGQGVYEQAQVIVDRDPYYYWIGYTSPRELFDGHLWVLNHAVETLEFTPIGK
jgi:hypothetical protein